MKKIILSAVIVNTIIQISIETCLFSHYTTIITTWEEEKKSPRKQN